MKAFASRAQGLIAINIAAVIFGSAALFGKLAISPVWIVATRAGFAALALLVIGSIRREAQLPPRRLAHSLIVTGLILAAHWLCFFASVQLAGVAVATLTFASFPLFTVLLENLQHRRLPQLAEIAAGIAIIVAVGLLIDPHNSHYNKTGVLAGLASAVTFAVFGHANKQLGQQLSPLQISLYQNAVVALSLAPALLFATPAPGSTLDWLWLGLLGIVTTALMHQLYFYALRRLSASVCSGFVALEPVYAILFAVLFFHEPVTRWIGLSALLILGASFTLLKYEIRPIDF